MKNNIKNAKKHGKTREVWNFIVSGFVVVIILIIVLLATIYGHGGTNPLVDAIQHAHATLVELFVMAIATLVAIAKGLEK